MKHMNQHDCEKILAKVYLCLDGEMSPQQEKDFLDEINLCSCCLGKYSIERSFKEFLVSRVEKKRVSPDIISLIRAKISQIAPH